MSEKIFPMICHYVYKGKSVTLILNLRKVKWKVSWSSSRIANYIVLSHFSCVWLFATLWTVAHQVPLSMGFSRQEYWRGLLFPSPGALNASGIKTSPPVSFTVQVSWSIVSDSLCLHGRWHTRLPCPSSIPRACSNSCPLSQWCHLTISSFVIPFSFLQSFPASGSFLMSQFFTSGGQNIGVSASASVLPMNIQEWLVWSPCNLSDS